MPRTKGLKDYSSELKEKVRKERKAGFSGAIKPRYSLREDIHSLRLTSEFVDLRSGYANRILSRGDRAHFESTSSSSKKTKSPNLTVGVFLEQ